MVAGDDRNAQMLGDQHHGQCQSDIARIRVDVDWDQQTDIATLDQPSEAFRNDKYVIPERENQSVVERTSPFHATMEEVSVQAPLGKPVEFGQLVALDVGTQHRSRANVKMTRDDVELRFRQYATHCLDVFRDLHRNAIHRAVECHQPHSVTYVPGEGIKIIVEDQPRCVAPVAEPVEHQPQVEPGGYALASQGIHHAVRAVAPSSLHDDLPYCGKIA